MIVFLLLDRHPSVMMIKCLISFHKLITVCTGTTRVYSGTMIFLSNEISQFLNRNCDWFLDNKLSIHFREDESKSIEFGTKKLLKIYCMGLLSGEMT